MVDTCHYRYVLLYFFKYLFLVQIVFYVTCHLRMAATYPTYKRNKAKSNVHNYLYLRALSIVV